MKILLLGKTGQLGWELRRTLATLGDVVAYDYPEIDYAHPELLPRLVMDEMPDLIVNAIAYTAVDKAEDEPDLAHVINAIAPGVLAETARKVNAAFVHYSTDYVFNGKKNAPYIEDDTPDPINVYGQSKLFGEQAVMQVASACLILRTSWMYSLRGSNYVLKVLEWAHTQPSIKIVTDQFGSPTSARLLAEITAQIIALDKNNTLEWMTQHRGIYHLAGGGIASRYEWAQEILRLDPNHKEQVVKDIIPALTRDFPLFTARPLYAALDCKRFATTFGLRLPPWKHALELCMEAE
jgi:dTDP-4-dehydrorhamnose reductase